MIEDIKKIRKIEVSKKDLIFAAFLLLFVLTSHWLTIAPTKFLITNTFKEIILGKEWQLEENGVHFTLNKDGFYMGQNENKLLLYDLKWDTESLSSQPIAFSNEKIKFLYDKIYWQRKGYRYLLNNGQKQKYYLIQASLFKGENQVNLYLNLDGKLSRVEGKMGQTDIGFWVKTEK